jgi:hypothetical protein
MEAAKKNEAANARVQELQEKLAAALAVTIWPHQLTDS